MPSNRTTGLPFGRPAPEVISRGRFVPAGLAFWLVPSAVAESSHVVTGEPSATPVIASALNHTVRLPAGGWIGGVGITNVVSSLVE